MLFLNDYLACISGSEDDCTTVTDAVFRGLMFGAVTGNFVASQYSASKLLSLSDIILKDPRRLARDAVYAKTIERQIGGSDVDKFVKSRGGNNQAALKAVQEDLKKFESIALDQTKAEKQAELKSLEEKISSRIGLEKSNAQVLSRAIEETATVNKHVLQNVSEIDDKLASVQNRLSERALPAQEKRSLLDAYDVLREKKAKLLKNLQGIDTQVKEVADAYNAELDARVRELKARVTKNPGDKKAVSETIAKLNEKRIKKTSTSSSISRYILNIDENGYSVVDANGSFKKLPKWAKELRLSQIRELPQILKRVLSENPAILDHPDKFIKKVAEYEHERYRVKTQGDLINSFENKQRLRALLGEKPIELGFPKGPDGRPLPGAKLSTVQREALKEVKPNWLEVDIPFSQLSKENIDKTIPAVVKNLELNIPSWSEGKPFSRLTKFFLPRPGLGRALGMGLRVGTGYVVEAGLLWFDYYNLREGLYEFAFNHSETARENFWPLLAPQCRMPKQEALQAPDTVKEHSKYFCRCQEEVTKADELHKLCQVPPSEMDQEVKTYCQLAQSGGRDRDLLIAKKYREQKVKNPKLAEILKTSVGCDVLKNYPSHCRWATTDVTDQGLYFMSLIRKHQLQKPVAELCPDVCHHWLEVANKKIEQLKGLKEIIELPQEKSQNKARKVCSKEFQLGDPPSNYESNKEWRKCQPPISCRVGGGARIVINNGKRELDYYEMKFNPDTQVLQSVRQYYSQIDNKKDVRGYSFLQANTQPSFEYLFNQNGDMARINIFGNSQGGTITEVISPDEILGKFNEAAYNANSSTLGRDRGELAISRRIEVLMLSRAAMRYCCKNEIECGSDNPAGEGEPSSQISNKPQSAVK